MTRDTSTSIPCVWLWNKCVALSYSVVPRGIITMLTQWTRSRVYKTEEEEAREPQQRRQQPCEKEAGATLLSNQKGSINQLNG